MPKKIVPPTYDSELLKQDVRWGEFRVGDLFKMEYTKKKLDANKLSFGGKHPYVTRKTGENGIRGYIDYDEQFLNDANTISFGMDTAVMYYQDKPYFTGDKIKVLFPKTELNKYVAAYMITSMRKAFQLFGWGMSYEDSVINNIEMQLPIAENNQPDYAYMKAYIAHLESEQITKLEAYLIAEGFADYRLTETDKQILKCEPQWGDFSLLDVFDWQSQIEINPLHLENLKISNEKKYPFYGQSTTNNGVILHCELKEEVLNNKMGNPTILIHSNNQNVVFLETPFYLKDGHGATSVLQATFLNKFNALFIMSSIKKVILDRFSYNAKATKIGLKNTIIELPITDDGVLDLAYMEAYVKAQQKFIIASVVQGLCTKNDESIK